MRRAALLALAVGLAGCVVSGDVLSTGDDETGDDGGGPDGGVPAACATGPTCDAGSVCGRLHDVETSRELTEATDAPLPTIRLVELDGLVDLGGPVTPDECGRYQVPVGTFAGELLVIAESAPDDDRWVATVTRHLSLSVDRRADGFALAAATDARWAAALGGGASVVDAGAMLIIFVDTLGAAVAPLAGEPVAGVSVTIDGLGSGDIHYFADTDPSHHGEPSTTLAATAASGAALVLPVEPLAAYGGLAPTCGFAPALGADLDGMLQVSALIGACAN